MEKTLLCLTWNVLGGEVAGWGAIQRADQRLGAQSESWPATHRERDHGNTVPRFPICQVRIIIVPAFSSLPGLWWRDDDVLFSRVESCTNVRYDSQGPQKRSGGAGRGGAGGPSSPLLPPDTCIIECWVVPGSVISSLYMLPLTFTTVPWYRWHHSFYTWENQACT